VVKELEGGRREVMGPVVVIAVVKEQVRGFSLYEYYNGNSYYYDKYHYRYRYSPYYYYRHFLHHHLPLHLHYYYYYYYYYSLLTSLSSQSSSLSTSRSANWASNCWFCNNCYRGNIGRRRRKRERKKERGLRKRK